MTERCGFVAIIGAPNAGKSTLINRMVGAKVSIVNRKVQTTRINVRGIVMADDDATQIILIDTPGIFSPKRRLDRAMVAAAWNGEADADITALLIDASKEGFDKDTRALLDTIEKRVKDGAVGDRKIILLLNKIDQMPADQLLKISAELNDRIPFTATFMISGLKGRGVQDVLDWISKNIPEGPHHYPGDQLSDLPERLLAAEITREKIYDNLHQELPYAATVETETWESFDDGSVKISQIIYLAREAHKPIILGKGGSRLKAIGMQSRKELESLLECRVHLKLFVKVKENWMDDPDRYSVWGLDPGA